MVIVALTPTESEREREAFTAPHLELAVSTGDEGPDAGCFQAFGACEDYCSDLEDAWIRSLCGLDCALDLARCIGTTLFDPSPGGTDIGNAEGAGGF